MRCSEYIAIGNQIEDLHDVIYVFKEFSVKDKAIVDIGGVKDSKDSYQLLFTFSSDSVTQRIMLYTFPAVELLI